MGLFDVFDDLLDDLTGIFDGDDDGGDGGDDGPPEQWGPGPLPNAGPPWGPAPQVPNGPSGLQQGVDQAGREDGVADPVGGNEEDAHGANLKGLAGYRGVGVACQALPLPRPCGSHR